MSIEAFGIKLYHEKLKVGPLVFTQLNVSFKWIAAAATREQSSVITYARIFLPGQNVAGELFYLNPPEQQKFGTLLVSISPISNASIGRMLGVCLPSNLPGLEILGSFLDNLMLQRAEIGFVNLSNISRNDNDKVLKLGYFEFRVLNATLFQVQKIILRELRVIYKNKGINLIEYPESLPEHETAVKELKAKQSSLSVMAVIEKKNVNSTDIKARIGILAKTESDVKTVAFSLLSAQNNSLTVRGLLALFEFSDRRLAYPHREECPPVF